MQFLREDVLVAMALPEEGGQILKDAGARVLYTGLGKVNAAYRLSKEIGNKKPKLVLNFGTAGSKLFKRGEIVAANRFLQRDMDVSPLGFRKFVTPFEQTPLYLEFEKMFQNLPHATVGTGDSFETDHSHDSGEVVDMEAFALAKVCYFEGIEFACVKFISDGADASASQDWKDSLSNVPDAFLRIFNELIQK